jgi:hypothetical protein
MQLTQLAWTGKISGAQILIEGVTKNPVGGVLANIIGQMIRSLRAATMNGPVAAFHG